MSITILIDLDDTLLINPFDSFMPMYLKLLSKKLSSFVAPEIMVKQLLLATEKMIKNTSPQNTLEATFSKNFYPVLGMDQSKIQPIIDDFYQTEFGALKSVTSLRPDAVKIVGESHAKGNRLIVATNPLFPLSAMKARLAWAGFPEPGLPFQFVTSYESMHFAKPNPAYYAEILGKFG